MKRVKSQKSIKLKKILTSVTVEVQDAVMYICKVFMYLIVLIVLVNVDASDIVMINHVLHEYAERVSNAA